MAEKIFIIQAQATKLNEWDKMKQIGLASTEVYGAGLRKKKRKFP